MQINAIRCYEYKNNHIENLQFLYNYEAFKKQNKTPAITPGYYPSSPF